MVNIKTYLYPEHRVASAHEVDVRTARLQELGLQYPLWVFDPDQHAWPRKLSSIPPGARPAKLTGWTPWSWEYGTTLRRHGDPLPPEVINSAEEKNKRAVGSSISDILSRLRYDDSFEHDPFTIVFDDASSSKSLADWVFTPTEPHYVAPHRITLIKRTWDGVPFCFRANKTDLFTNPCAAYGMAHLVSSDAEFLSFTGVEASHEPVSDIRRANIQLLDGEEEEVRGVVFSQRSHDSRGVDLSRGPDYAENKALLYDTPLEGVPWEEVKDYLIGRPTGPLV